MPNIASVLKSEIARVARKEIRAEIEALRKNSAHARSLIAALNRRVQDLERRAKKASAARRSETELPTTKGEAAEKLRFSAKGFAAQRQRLGLSAADVAKLLNVSSLSIYKWEGAKARPRASYLPAIAAFRKLGKRNAAQILTQLK
jgi:DNA-binding transcriptional regulator YiaG